MGPRKPVGDICASPHPPQPPLRKIAMSNPIPIPSGRRKQGDSPRENDYYPGGEAGSSGGSGRSDDLFRMDSSNEDIRGSADETQSPTTRDYVYDYSLNPSPRLQRHLERARPRANTQPLAGTPPSRTGRDSPPTAPGSAFLTPTYPTNVPASSGRGGYPSSYNAPQTRSVTQYGFPRYQPQSLGQPVSVPTHAAAPGAHWQPSPGYAAPPVVQPSSGQYYPGQYPASYGQWPPPHAQAGGQSSSTHPHAGSSRTPASYYPASYTQSQSEDKERQMRRRPRDG